MQPMPTLLACINGHEYQRVIWSLPYVTKLSFVRAVKCVCEWACSGHLIEMHQLCQDLLLSLCETFVGGGFHAVPLFHTPCKESR
jgi:hypothetical protein